MENNDFIQHEVRADDFISNDEVSVLGSDDITEDAGDELNIEIDEADDFLGENSVFVEMPDDGGLDYE